MFQQIPVPWYLQVFVILISLLSLTLTLKEKLLPITLEDIKKMNFESVVEYLEDIPVANRQGPLWDAAVERGINAWTHTTDLKLTKQFMLLIESPKQVSHIMRFNIRVGVSAFASLGPIT